MSVDPMQLYDEAFGLLRQTEELLVKARKAHELAVFQAKQNAETVIRQANEIRSLTHDINRALRNHSADLSEAS